MIPAMQEQLERELKWRLDADGHQRLQALLTAAHGPRSERHQINRFYDTAKLTFLRHWMAIRLRREDERLLLTCKRKAANDGIAHQQQEWECWLNAALWPQRDLRPADWLPLPPVFRSLLAGAALVPLGGFENHRREWHIRGEHIALDRTSYGDETDYELEVETSDASRTAAWQRQLTEWNVAVTPQSQGKYQRYLARRGLLTVAGRS